MRRIIKIALIFISLTQIGCGQKSAEEQADFLRRHDDSQKAAVVSEIKSENQSKKQNIEQTSVSKKEVYDLISKTNLLAELKNDYRGLVSELSNAKAKLEFERSELDRAKEFHIGRSKSEREREIRKQYTQVQIYEEFAMRIQGKISELSVKIDDLQSEISRNK
jgi:hypothetical protein